MKYFAVLDTNVLVSALMASAKAKESNPMKVVKYVFSGKVRPLYNDDILAEYKDVLGRKKFRFNPILIETVISEIKRIGVAVEALEMDEFFPDPDDAVFFEVAMAFEESENRKFLVTGNTKHFPRHPIVVTPMQFVNILEEEGIEL